MTSARDVARRFAWAALAAATAACDWHILVGSDDAGAAGDSIASSDAVGSIDTGASADSGDSGDTGSGDAAVPTDTGIPNDAGGSSDATVDSNDADASGDASDAGDSGDAGPDDGGGACSLDATTDATLTPLVVPWSTSFENGTIADPGTSCYMVGTGSTFFLASAPSPVHSGQHSAGFTVDSTQFEAEARCVRQGAFPAAAYYGAWYYVPQFEVNSGNWNLLHFRAASQPNVTLHGLWDISLVNGSDGGLNVALYDFLRMREIAPGYPGPGQDAGAGIPINQWFHLEAFFRRACDNTGEFTLYMGGQVVYSLKGLPTADALWGEWHFGNLATALSPATSTVYVDDVTISTTGP